MADNHVTKVCLKCNLEKPFSDFHNWKYSKDGKKSYCKICNTKNAVDYAKRNPEKTALRVNAWHRNNRDKVHANGKRWIERHPERHKQLVKEISFRRKDKQAEYVKKNIEKYRKIKSDWKKRNPESLTYYAAKRRSQLLKAIPKWYDSSKVKEIYKKAKQMGLVVDHIVPLISEIVCGLHCHENLMPLDHYENSSKSNRYWPDMP